MKKGKFSRGTILGFLILALCASLLSSEAKAVTYGSTVADPITSAPWVVSIWNSQTNDVKDAEFRCTGTLISPHTVLTAAHCTLEPGAYFVKVKSQALNDQTPLTTVSGVWTSPRYDPRNFTNDIGLLKLDEEFLGITYPSLANAQAAKSINSKSTFTLYGWGRDQSGNLADLLRGAKLKLQDKLATKYFKKFFNSKTMISAGRKIVTENVWSGACPGDSGGPLIISINQINVIAGVTSFGEKSCLTPNPTVFSRVSYYFSDIQNGLKSVELKSKVVNRTAPVATVDPQISGNLITNGSITCEPGQWNNSVSTSISWTSPKRLIGTTTPSIRVLTSDAGQVFSCTVIVSTKSGTIVRKVLTKQSGKAPSLTAQPAISGVDLSAPVKVGSALRCDNWNWDTPVDTESVQWFLTSQANPPAPVNGQLIGSGRALLLDSNIISQLKNRFVVCDVTGVRNGFSVDGIASIKLNPLDGPTITSVNVSGSSLSLGSSLTCLFNASLNATSVEINWGTSSDGISLNAFTGSTGNVLQITQNVIQQGAGKVVACQVKVSNTAGQAQRVGVGSSTFPSPPVTPIVSIGNSGTVTANSYLSCSAQTSSGYYGPLNYQWGITSTLNSTIFIGGPLSSSSSLSLNSNLFLQATGNYLTCVATATNDAGSSSGAASIFVPSAVLPLPALSRPSTVGESTQISTLTESISIPNITGFDSTKMSLSLALNPAAGSCSSPIQINSTPAIINCSGLQPLTSYSAQLTVSYLTANSGATQVSPILNFTTAALQSSLYVCATSCTGSLTNAQLIAEIADQRTIEAKSLTTVTVNGSPTGAPITHSTCVGSGCSPGIAPTLPISCGSAGVETTEVISNVTAQITTAFRYCKPNALDTIAPTITNNSLSTTGYAPIIPTAGVPGTSIQVRFGASDAAGVASTKVRLVNPGNVAVSTVPGTFLVGSTTSGIYQGYLATASSGPTNGDVYQIQAQASDAAGNASNWVTIGTFTVQVTTLVPSFSSTTSNASGFTVQIINYDGSYTWTSTATGGATASISPSGLVTVSSLSSGVTSTLTVTTSRSGYGSGSTSIAGTSSTAALPVFGVPIVASITTNSVVVTQPARPSSWNSNWQLIAQVFSNDQSNLLGASSPGSYYTPGANLSVVANNVGGILPDTNYQVRFAVYDSSSSAYSYGPFTTFHTAALAGLQVVAIAGGTPTGSNSVGSTIRVSFRALDGIGISNAWVQVRNSLGNVIGTYDASLVSGSNTDGTYVSSISTIIPDFSNGGTFAVEAKVGGNGRIMWTWTPIGSFNLNYIAPVVIPPASMSTSAQSYGAQVPGRNFSFNVGISGATSVTAMATNGTTTLTAPFLQGPSGDNWVYATSGGSGGTTGYTGSMAVPASVTSGTYSLTYTATNSAGVATQFNGGNFYIPQPTSQASVTQTYFTGSVQQRCPDCTTIRAGFTAVYWEIWTLNASTLTITATNGTDVLTSPESAHGGNIQQSFDYGNGVKKWNGYIQLWPGAPIGTFNATWIVTDSAGLSARFSAGTFTITSL